MIGVHGFWLLGMIGPLLLVGLIVLVVWAVTRAGRVMPATQYGPPPAPPREAPIDILQRRFASGEINAEEYEKARDLLKGDSPTGR
ncbi:MAG TPA: SHOCT domain-containing protein [Candidatus Dormibacteraeota bacterium]|nr:SHOCT domain-containing protein [Candidatus Dormibacteraeota bacterium]